ncbi:MAG: hypothetical protein K8J08_05820 [Thermoanaerobaculia bacterium]|nr:hypothetical protein [Thermoanaerobaculia bacterium]
MNTTLERYNQHVMFLLTPDIDQPVDAFYDEQGKLKGKYVWYVYFHRSISQQMLSMQSDVQRLEKQFREANFQ